MIGAWENTRDQGLISHDFTSRPLVIETLS